MMDKIKRKTPPKNFFRYLLDEYILFRRDFVIETPASIEDCANQLRAIDWGVDPLSASITHLASTKRFNIVDKQGAVANGSIEYRGSKTRISGKVTLSGGFWVIFGAVCGCALLFIQFFNPFNILISCTTVLYGLYMLYHWIMMYLHRESLLQRIKVAVQLAEMGMNLANTEDEPVIQLFNDNEQVFVNKSKR